MEKALRGSAHVTATKVSGWVFDPDVASQNLQIQLRLNGKVPMETIANLPRPDVNRAFGTEGDHGFLFSPLDLTSQDLERIEIHARSSASHPWQLVKIPIGTQKRTKHYQTFDDAKGASKSSEKLKALRLSLLENRHSDVRPLKGLSVLDLGCNEGFFCGEALRQGARRVVGIDFSKQFIELAGKRFPKAEFILGSWWNIPDEKFDVIFFLSAIHYEPKQRAFLQKLTSHLTATGTLVIECGISKAPDKTWEAVQRADGVRRYPSVEMFTQELMKPYAVRFVGPSVMQAGDPMPRRVFHCTPKETMALIVTGPTKSGKSTLAGDLGEHNIPLVHTDNLLGRIMTDKRYDWSPVAKVVRKFPVGIPIHGKIGNEVAAECAREFVDIIMLESPLEADLFCIEGEILRHDAIMDELSRRLCEHHIRPWFIAPNREGLTSRALPG